VIVMVRAAPAAPWSAGGAAMMAASASAGMILGLIMMCFL
jgi:hypothetical protein